MLLLFTKSAKLYIWGLGGETRCTTRLRVSGPLASDWLLACPSMPSCCCSGRSSAISDFYIESRVRSIAPALWRVAYWRNFLPSGCYRLVSVSR
jgi:hypothetical protein